MQLFYVLPFFLLIAILNPIHAVDYLVINNATATLGGARFGQEIGVQYTEQTLQFASEFIWETFKQTEYERKYYPEITMVVTSFPGITSTQENYIRLAQTISKITLVMSGLKLLESYIMKLHVFGNGLATMKPQ